MIEGALILLAGIVVGRFLPGRRRKLKSLIPVKAVCGCGHGLETHDPETKACHARVRKYKWDSYAGFMMSGKEVFAGYADCACRQYTGPEPLPEFFAQEIGG